MATTTVDNLYQALSLDVSILKVLLQRHRCSHGRAIYFRRLSMALKAVERHQVLESAQDKLEEFERHAIDYTQRRRRKRNKKRADDDDDDHWNILQVLDEDQKALKEEWDGLLQLYTVSFWEIISRIEHASTALFLEVSRGFFFPFCTVALGAIARIRTILLRVGRYSLSKLHELVATDQGLRKFLSAAESLEASMSQYLQMDKPVTTTKSTSSAGISYADRRQNLMRRLGFTLKKNSSNIPGSEDAATQEREQQNNTSDSDVLMEDLSGDHPAASDDDSVDGKPKAMKTTTLNRYDAEEDDVGESVAFESFTIQPPIATHTASSADIGSSTFSRAKLPDPVHLGALDRNMELVESFKKMDKTDKKKKKKRSAEESLVDDKREKKRSEPSIEKAKKKKKKKRGTKGDFFDALFD